MNRTTPIPGHSSRVLRRLAATALAAAALAGAAGTASATASGAAPEPVEAHGAAVHKQVVGIDRSARADSFDRLIGEARAHGRVRVTISLADAPQRTPDASVRRQLAQEVRAGHDALHRALGDRAPAVAGEAPATSALVTARELVRLRDEPSIRSVSESVDLTTAGTSTNGAQAGVQLTKWWHQKQIGLDWTSANGYTGAGQKVVIVDTGVDATHPWLQGRVVDGACFSQTGCGNGATSQYGVAAAAPCTYAYICAHGTHVAHIAAGKYGVAPGARIVAIKAASKRLNSQGTYVPNFDDADLINAFWYAYNYVSPAPASINLSVGGGLYTGLCDSKNSTLAQWITANRSRGTATVVAAGNDNSSTAIGAPACMSSAVAVGNATLTTAGVPAVLGGVTGGSNSNSLIDLWAPGTDICSAVPVNLDHDGTADGVDCSYYGTSMAAPQVAGAFAVMKAVRPTWTVSQTLAALVRDGTALTDSRNGVTRSLLRLSNAVYYG